MGLITGELQGFIASLRIPQLKQRQHGGQIELACSASCGSHIICQHVGLTVKQMIPKIHELPGVICCEEALWIQGGEQMAARAFNVGRGLCSAAGMRVGSCPCASSRLSERLSSELLSNEWFVAVPVCRVSTHTGLPEAGFQMVLLLRLSSLLCGWTSLVLVHGLQAFVWLDF